MPCSSPTRSRSASRGGKERWPGGCPRCWRWRHSCVSDWSTSRSRRFPGRRRSCSGCPPHAGSRPRSSSGARSRRRRRAAPDHGSRDLQSLICPCARTHRPELSRLRRAPYDPDAKPATRSGQHRSEWHAARLLLPYLSEFKWRVLIALLFLSAAKFANVGVPLLLKEIVDSLSPDQTVLVLPLALLLAYGALRLSTTLFAELRDVVFVRVTQRAIRRIALTVFRHLHALSLRFHLERQTGGVSRDIERGSRGVSTLMSYMLFSIIPVLLEFSLVATVLLTKFDWRFAAVTFGAVAIYIGFTIAITEWRMDIRRRAN
ncbi:MAG: hypothetical protein JNL68_01935, partial [Burkholderiales bacterium]|nr:hypothetical protein [Burkholderiales bacterium]